MSRYFIYAIFTAELMNTPDYAAIFHMRLIWLMNSFRRPARLSPPFLSGFALAPPLTPLRYGFRRQLRHIADYAASDDAFLFSQIIAMIYFDSQAFRH
jgi:hypothetical protein